MNLDSSIEFLKGIGPERAKLIKNVLGISSVEDFLHFFPNRYLDKTKIHVIRDLAGEGSEVQLKGKISGLQELGAAKGKRLTAKFNDGTSVIDLVWFQYSKWLKEQIPQDKEVLIFGKVTTFNHSFSMSHPEIEIFENQTQETYLQPIYPTSEKLTKRGIHK